jgi:Flp pilus assembly protein TadD
VQLAPDSPYYAYVYGIALNSAGKNEQALEVLRTAQMRFPAYAELALALATMQRDRGESAAALEYARQLQRLLPADPRARSLIDELSGDRRP